MVRAGREIAQQRALCCLTNAAGSDTDGAAVALTGLLRREALFVQLAKLWK